ncbi:ATP-dependent RNA helicase DDX60 [Nematocida sp. AWRm77]|nr:ATP-dependent RNA helicase DDX60 [Nematocida sp. AWRm77]
MPMTKEMEESVHTEWYRTQTVQIVDISEAFVGIGKMMINGHALYRYMEDLYSIPSSALPLALVRRVTEEIAYSLEVSDFKDSYLVLFRDEEGKSAGRDICTREMASVLAKNKTLKVIWFSSVEDGGFFQFVKDEHICIGVGYSNESSLGFLNAILGFSLYAGVMDEASFRPPRIYMYVLNPSQHNRSVQYRPGPHRRVEWRDAWSRNALAEALRQMKAFPENVLERVQHVIGEGKELQYYPRKMEGVESLPEEVLQAVYREIEHVETCALSEVFDGVLAQKPEVECVPVRAYETGIVPEGSMFIPTTMSSVRFYSKEQEKNIRAEQMYIESLKKTAQSLHEGKHLHNPISLVADKVQTKKKKDTKEKVSKKQLEIIERNKKQIEVEARKKDVVYLKSFLSKYKSFSTVQERRRHLESFVPRVHSGFICAKVLLLSVEFYTELWALERRKKKPSEKNLVSLYMSILEFVEKHREEASPKEMEYVLQSLLDLGFVSTVLELCEKHGIPYTNTNDPERKLVVQGREGESVPLSFDPKATSAPNDFDISFLMRSAGDKLKRTLDSRPDSRLLFEPDRWQYDLLNIVEAEESAVICAPTSSGKTFICYYAMEKVLRDSNDNIVVFVAPTKALVNQVAADVYARFGSKPYIKQNNILQGICMGDFQISPFNCQILITVPGVLESILTLPPEPRKKEKPYLERLRYIVIDEVHKITDRRMGVSMEKIIQLSPCPLLLLSATLGNLDQFYKWAVDVEGVKGRKCHLVQHKERYCEIKNYVFVPQKMEKLETCHKSTREGDKVALASLHSLFAYSFRGIKEDGFSDDVNFLPEELLNLYYAIFAVLRKDQKGLIKEFRPQRFFKTNCITKRDVKEYERYVITKFRELMKNNDLEEAQLTKIYDILIREARNGFQQIEKDLSEKLSVHGMPQPSPALSPEDGEGVREREGVREMEGVREGEGEMSEKVLSSMEGLSLTPSGLSPDTLLYSVEYLLENILDLVVELESKNMLPCIVFNLEREVCNALAVRLVEELDRWEKVADSTLTKNDIRENEKILKEMKRSRDATLHLGKSAWIEESQMAEEMSGRIIDPNAKDPRFCFTDPAIASSGAYILDEYAKSLKKTGKIDGRLIHALYRGIGVHHTGTPKKYRNMVEILFRMRQLRVIFATETLALGINMPCRTAVFAGDSLSLDAMSFKQMAGRAGRRGYDTQGNVVFFGIPKQKIQSLITSYLPKIKGAYSYTSTLAIQLAKPTVHPDVLSCVVKYPLMSLSYPSPAFLGTERESGEEFRARILKEQLKYLVHKSFLSASVLSSSEPRDLSQISSLTDIALNHVAYDPSTLVLMALINEGVLDDMCTDVDKETASERIMHLVASLFEVYPVPKHSRMSQLAPLPAYIQSRLEFYRKESAGFSKSFMTEKELELYEVLGFEGGIPKATALSFFSLVHLNKPKSSYILDYFKNPGVKDVLKDTGMGETNLWARLKGVSDLLETLLAYYTIYDSTSLAVFYIEHTQTLFLEKFKKMYA